MYDRYPMAFGYVDKVLMSARSTDSRLSRKKLSAGGGMEINANDLTQESISELQSHLQELTLYLKNDGVNVNSQTLKRWFEEVESAYPNWQNEYKMIHLVLAFKA